MKILVSALEPSANLHLGPVLEILKPEKLVGIFDESFGKPLISSKEFSVMGILDVIKKIQKARNTIKILAKMSLEVEHILLIDSPAFNIPLAKEIRKLNKDIPITYYILPKVWAWKPKRVEKIEKYCTNVASIFPFEEKFYNNYTYVGNPLLDEILKFKNKVTQNKKIVFMPGSRKSEIAALMPIYKKVALHISDEKIVIIPKHLNHEEIKTLYGDLSDFTISHDTHESLFEADFAFICSGTATLEAALIGTPFVLCYKAKKLDYFIGRQFVKLKYAGLANIIFDFEKKDILHKEFLQHEVNVENLVYEYKNMDREKFFEKSKELKAILKKGSAQDVAKFFKI